MYTPDDMFADLSGDVATTEIAERMSGALHDQSPEAINTWIVTLVNRISDYNPEYGATETHDVTYGSVRLRVRNIRGPSIVKGFDERKEVHQAIESWCTDYICQSHGIYVNIVEISNETPLSDVIQALDMYKREHEPHDVSVNKRMSETNKLITDKPWFQSWLRERTR